MEQLKFYKNSYYLFILLIIILFSSCNRGLFIWKLDDIIRIVCVIITILLLIVYPNLIKFKNWLYKKIKK